MISFNFQKFLYNEDVNYSHFIETLWEDPSDTNFLVFADWLEEQGDPLADIIRNQLEIWHNHSQQKSPFIKWNGDGYASYVEFGHKGVIWYKEIEPKTYLTIFADVDTKSIYEVIIALDVDNETISFLDKANNRINHLPTEKNNDLFYAVSGYKLLKLITSVNFLKPIQISQLPQDLLPWFVRFLLNSHYGEETDKPVGHYQPGISYFTMNSNGVWSRHAYYHKYQIKDYKTDLRLPLLADPKQIAVIAIIQQGNDKHAKLLDLVINRNLLLQHTYSSFEQGKSISDPNIVEKVRKELQGYGINVDNFPNTKKGLLKMLVGV